MLASKFGTEQFPVCGVGVAFPLAKPNDLFAACFNACAGTST